MAEFLFVAAGPIDFDGRRRVLSQSKGRGEIARGAIARPAMHSERLFAGGAFEMDHAADAVAVAQNAGQADREPVIVISTVVAKQVGGAIVGGDEKIQVAVTVEISVCGASRYDWPIESRAHRGGYVREVTIPQIAKK